MKLYLYVAAFLALCSALAYGAHIKHKADRADAAESALTAYKAAEATREKEMADAQVKDLAIRNGLIVALNTVSAKVADLQSQIPKQSVKYVPVPGKPGECPRPRLDPQFVSVYNAASTASTGAVPDPH